MVKGNAEEKSTVKKETKKAAFTSLDVKKLSQTPDKFTRNKTFVGSVKKEAKTQPKYVRRFLFNILIT